MSGSDKFSSISLKDAYFQVWISSYSKQFPNFCMCSNASAHVWALSCLIKCGKKGMRALLNLHKWLKWDLKSHYLFLIKKLMFSLWAFTSPWRMNNVLSFMSRFLRCLLGLNETDIILRVPLYQESQHKEVWQQKDASHSPGSSDIPVNSWRNISIISIVFLAL